MTTELVKYDAMCRAIEAAYEVDEVKDFRDKAVALEIYARQAKNTEAERQACEIRLRAERRCGQLLKETEKAKGNRNDGGFGGRIARPPNETKTLSDRGISKDQSSRWQKLANVPDDQFEAAITGPYMPTTSGIIEAAKPNPVTPVSTDALRLWSALCGFERENWLAQDPEEIMATMVPTMRADVLRLAPLVSEWIGRIHDVGIGCQQAAE